MPTVFTIRVIYGLGQSCPFGQLCPVYHLERLLPPGPGRTQPDQAHEEHEQADHPHHATAAHRRAERAGGVGAGIVNEADVRAATLL